MKAVEVKIIFEFLSKLKLNKIDKDIRISILKNYAELFSCQKEIELKIDEVRKKILSDEDINSINECNKNKTSLPKELIEKINEYNLIIEDVLNTEYDVKITKISEEKFVNNISNAEVDYTPMDIIRMKPILK